MNRRILLVDDEPRILDGFRRNLRRQFEVVTAASGAAGIQEIATNDPFAVVVSDYRMPEMNGVQFLTRVADLSPNTVRMMLTGEADMAATISAINDGRVFRFLTKPCAPDALVTALDDGIAQYRLVEAERELLEITLHQTVAVLIDLIGLIDPQTHHHSVRISERVSSLCTALDLDHAWEYMLAATLSQLGTIALPADLVERFRAGKQLRPSDTKMIGDHPQSAHNLLAKIPRLERVARMVLMQHRPSGIRPMNVSEPDDEDIVAIGAHLLDVSLQYERMLAQGLTPSQAIQRFPDGGPPFRAQLVSSLAEIAGQKVHYVQRRAGLAELEPGMMLNSDLKTVTGLMLLANGTELTAAHLERVNRFSDGAGVDEPIDVLVMASV